MVPWVERRPYGRLRVPLRAIVQQAFMTDGHSHVLYAPHGTGDLLYMLYHPPQYVI